MNSVHAVLRYWIFQSSILLEISITLMWNLFEIR